MDIIPVLDLRDGVVVHAQRGERASYAALHSPLVDGCEATDVLAALLAAASRAADSRTAPAVYVADLDGIERGVPQWALLERLRAAAEPAALWLDAGFADADAALAAAGRGFVPVIGSESLLSIDSLSELRRHLPESAWLLSLDADSHGARDPSGVIARTECWPRRVIAMDLLRVGSGAGGTGDWLRRCMRLAPDRNWIAAGGVRDRRDLQQLERAGVASVLVATALHSGALEAAQGPSRDA